MGSGYLYKMITQTHCAHVKEIDFKSTPAVDLKEYALNIQITDFTRHVRTFFWVTI